MSQRVQVLLVCDLHDGDEVEGTETVAFGLDGASYEIDVCDEHAEELRDSFAVFVGVARRAGRPVTGAARRGSRPARVAASGAAPAANNRTSEIREWARNNGHAVNERGRLPQAVVAAYDAAH